MARPTKGSKTIDEKWVNSGEMARLLGISVVQLNNYRKLTVNPIPHDSTVRPIKYPTSAGVRWFTLYQNELTLKRETPRQSKAEVEVRLKAAQADLVEMEVAREQEITVTVTEAASRINKVCEAFVASFGSIPGKHAHEFVALPDEVHAQVALKQMTDKIRSELSEIYGIEESE